MDRRWAAAAVHALTASGAVCGLFALLAAIERRPEVAFLWLGLALVIDGIDGYFARLVAVKAVLPRFSGEQLDLVVDYVTYVFVPAVMLVQADRLGPRWGVVLAAAILLSSLFHFSDTRSKTEDHSFVGFPAIWNIVVFYIFALGLGSVAASLLVIACVALTFVPLEWVHPLRVRRLRPLTLAISAAWALAALSATLRGFPAATPEQAALIAVAIYGAGLGVPWRRAQQ